LKTAGLVGEAKLRDFLVKFLERDPEEILGYGDDAVAIKIGGGKVLVAHTNMLVGSIDIPLGMGWRLVGRKAVVMNVSDIVCKGATPLTILFSWGVPRGFRVKAARDVASGLNSAARECGIYVTGGDLGESEDFVLAGTAFGLAEADGIISRSGAAPGDLLAATGFFGLTGVGFKILLKRLKASGLVRRKALGSVYRPRVRQREALAVAGVGAATAGMDCSDGLAASLHWLSRMSGVGFIINHIPIPLEVKRFSSSHRLDPIDLALYEGGEEYELIFCIKPRKWADAAKAVSRVGGALHRIGVATKRKRIVLEIPGRAGEAVKDRGWQHFRKWGK